MADRAQSWKYGDTMPVVTKAVATATVIYRGDLIATVTSGGAPYAAGDHVWNTNLSTTQNEFHNLFLGVSADRSRSGDIDVIKVNTRGVFEFDCAAATFEIGDIVGPAKQSGNLLEPQKVVSVATANLAIGRVARRYGSNTTTVLVKIESTRMDGGVQVMA